MLPDDMQRVLSSARRGVVFICSAIGASIQVLAVGACLMLQHQRAPLRLLAIIVIWEWIHAVNEKVLTLSNKRELRSSPLGLRITPTLKSALEQAADDDHRSMASLAELIISEWLATKGYLNSEDASKTDDAAVQKSEND